MPVDEKIKVFDADDKALKILGELLSNDTSRRIIKCLMEKQMYTNEISTKLDIRVSLVIHHLKKLEDIGVLEIEHKQIVRKGNKHRFFRMIPNLFVAPNETRENLDKKGILKQFFREGIKFMIIGVAVFTTVLITDFDRIVNPDLHYSVPFPQYVVPLSVLIIGLLIERILVKKRN